MGTGKWKGTEAAGGKRTGHLAGTWDVGTERVWLLDCAEGAGELRTSDPAGLTPQRLLEQRWHSCHVNPSSRITSSQAASFPGKLRRAFSRSFSLCSIAGSDTSPGCLLHALPSPAGDTPKPQDPVWCLLILHVWGQQFILQTIPDLSPSEYHSHPVDGL